MVFRHWHDKALQRKQLRATPEAMCLRRSTAESVRHFEIPYLWPSAFSCTRSSRSASGDEFGGHRLQLETDDEVSRSTQVGRRAGHGLNCFRKSTFTSKLSPSQKKKRCSRPRNIALVLELQARFVTV